MIPKVSAALSRILRPIRFRAKTGTGSAKLEADVSEHESAREDARGIVVTAVKEAPQESHPLPFAQVSSKKEGEPNTPKSEEIGLTAIILEMRKQSAANDNGEVASTYENSSREQKTGSKLPKGSMVDRKAG